MWFGTKIIQIEQVVAILIISVYSIAAMKNGRHLIFFLDF